MARILTLTGDSLPKTHESNYGDSTHQLTIDNALVTVIVGAIVGVLIGLRSPGAKFASGSAVWAGVVGGPLCYILGAGLPALIVDRDVTLAETTVGGVDPVILVVNSVWVALAAGAVTTAVAVAACQIELVSVGE